jgi:hypothetical protein
MVLVTLFSYSLLMVALPLSAFFAASSGSLDVLLEVIVGPDPTQGARLSFAGVLGVICVNLVVAGYVVQAWREQPPTEKKKTE